MASSLAYSCSEQHIIVVCVALIPSYVSALLKDSASQDYCMHYDKFEMDTSLL